MIRLLICLFLAVFANANLENFNEVLPIADAPTSPPVKDGDKCNAESLNKIVCENDRLIFCSPTNQIVSYPCFVNGRQGFCNCEKTGCVAKKPTCGEVEVTDCLTPNTKLPDNFNCRKFSYCDEKGKKVTLECPGNLIYDPNKEKCVDQSTARCTRVVCPSLGTTLRLIPFPQARNYYLLCYQGRGDVRKCSDKFYAVQNGACRFDCKMKKESGTFRDTNLERCQKGVFYACTKLGGNYITLPNNCPSGKYFDENLGICTETDTCV